MDSITYFFATHASRSIQYVIGSISFSEKNVCAVLRMVSTNPIVKDCTSPNTAQIRPRTV